MFAVWSAVGLAFVDVAWARSLPLATTRDGPVRGAALAGGVSAFYGIPFARPPTGQLRWRAPVPPEPWIATLDLSREPTLDDACLQPYGVFGGHPHNGTIGTEDCLKLIVHTPRLPEHDENSAALPVMLWIHGGAFGMDDYYEQGLYNGHELARRYGVVVVSIQYRLGVLGFLALADLQKADSEKSTGNYGMQDQRLAMRWVQSNIAAFGGDPTKVTVFGQSAGAMSVCYHMVSLASRGFFRGAIVESGSCNGGLATVATREALWRTSGPKTGCHGRGQEYVDCLRAVDGAVLLSRSGAYGPTIDGSFVGLLDSPLVLARTGRINRIPAIFGVNEHELQFLCYNDTVGSPDINKCGFLKDMFPHMPVNDMEALGFLEATMGHSLGPHRWSRVLAEYPLTSYGGDSNKRFSDVFSDAFAEPPLQDPFIGECGTLRDARVMHEATGEPIWMYHFESLGSHTFVGHGDEMPYLFQPQNYSFPSERWNKTKSDPLLADILGRYWTNFAKYQDPNGGGTNLVDSYSTPLPLWPRVTGLANLTDERLLFVDASGPRGHRPLRAERCNFWKQLLEASPEGAWPILV